MTATLQERAAAAYADKKTAEALRKDQTRAKSLADARERWSRPHCIGDRLGIPCPPAEEFYRLTDVPHPGGGRGSSRIYGWLVTIDDVRFLTNADHYSNSGDWVLITCPDCECEYAVHFYGLDDLGQLLKTRRHYSHRCLDIETRDVAYQLATASRETGLSVDEVYSQATERHHELISRVRSR